LGLSNHPSPRGALLSGLLNELQREKNKNKKKSYTDRGSGTILDGYTKADLPRLSTELLQSAAMTSNVALRNRAVILTAHFMVVRGESSRAAELPDLICMELADEGPQKCMAMILIMNTGKLNQVGRTEYAGMMRNREVEICPQGAMFLFLLKRFDLDREPFPDFTRRENWYMMMSSIASIILQKVGTTLFCSEAQVLEALCHTIRTWHL